LAGRHLSTSVVHRIESRSRWGLWRSLVNYQVGVVYDEHSSNGDGCDNYRDIWSRCPPSTTEPRPPRSRALMQAVAAEAAVVEGERLLDWKRIEQSAALFIADNQA